MAISLKLAAPPGDDEILDLSKRNPAFQFERSAAGELQAARNLIPGLDKTRIVSARPKDDGSALLIRQESGHTAEIPWDFVLYHLERDCPYYKGRRAGKHSKAAAAKRIARRVQEVRMRIGLTASALAARSGIRRPNISRIESGRHVPSLDTLERLAEALGVPVEELVR